MCAVDNPDNHIFALGASPAKVSTTEEFSPPSEIHLLSYAEYAHRIDV
jgi:hypothetical protein